MRDRLRTRAPRDEAAGPVGSHLPAGAPLHGRAAYALALQRTAGNRATTQLLQRNGDGPIRTDGGKPKYLLVDPSDADGDLDRLISLDEPYFQSFYIDNNIVNGKAWVDQETGAYSDMTVQYTAQRAHKFDLSVIPLESKVTVKPGPHSVKASLLRFDYFQLGPDGFIYPMYNGGPVYDENLTPNLVSMRTQVAQKAGELHQLRVLLETAGAFANIVSMYGIVLGFHQPEIPGHEPVRQLGKSRESVVGLPRTKVTEPEIEGVGMTRRRGGRTGYVGPREQLETNPRRMHEDPGAPYPRTDPRVPGVPATDVPGRVQSRINLRLGIRKPSGKMVEGSGFWYAWSKHGGTGPPSKSQFIHEPSEIFNLLKTPHVVDTTARPLSNGNFVREVEFDAVTVGRLPQNEGGAETSVMTVITDKWGNLVNTFPGTLSGEAKL